MATQVPYTGAPTIGPESAPIPSRSTDAPLGAFGSSVAQATTHLGQVVDKAGDEIYARALAMQQLNESAAATQATADFTTALGERYAQYRSLEGKAAVDGYKQYSEDINGLRAKFRESLGSPFAQRAYDQETRTVQSRSVFSAAAHAGDENKKYLLGSSDDHAKAMANQSGQHPDDEGLYQQAKRVNAENARNAAVIHGRGEDFAKNMELGSNTNLNAQRITGAMQKDPARAQAMLDKARADGSIDGGAADQLQKQIESTTYNKTSVKEAAILYNAPENKDATTEQLIQRAEKKAEDSFPNDPVYKEKLVAQTLLLRSKTQTAKRADEYDRATVLQGAAYGVGVKDGKLPGSIEELDPAARAAYDNANPRTQAAIMRRLTANAKGDYAPTPENQARYNYWRGVLTDPQATAEQRESALKEDAFNDLRMPAGQARQLIDLRNKLYKNTLADPSLPHAMGVISGMLSPELGLSKSRNQDEYFRFTGAFGEALRQAADQKKGILSDDEIRKIGADLLQKQQVPGKIFGTMWPTSTENFRVDVPTEYADRVKKIYASQGEPEPTQDRIQQLYTAERVKAMSNGFTTLFGKKVTTRVPQ